MATKDKRLYTTGEVAKIFSLKKDTLFYYDKIGLFSPNYRKGSTNYRYYGSDQLKVLDAIISLRAMGIPIKELKNFIENMNTDSFLDMIELENKKLMSLIDEYSVKAKTIQELSRRIKLAQSVETNQLLITKEENRNYVSVDIDKKYKDSEIAWNKAYEKVWDMMDTAKIVTIGSSLPLEEFQNEHFGNVDKIICYTIIKTKQRLDKGIYANMYVSGSYDNLIDGYKLFKTKIEERNLKIISDIHEEYVIEAMSEKNEDNYTTHLFARIEELNQ